MQLLGICGLIDSGKTTAANTLHKEFGFTSISFADPLKDIVAHLFGWDRQMIEGATPEARALRNKVDQEWSEALGIRNLTPRLMLQQWGTDVVRNGFHPNFWIEVLKHRIRHGKLGNAIVVSDVRYPNEIEAIRKLGGRVIRIQRGELPPWVPLIKQYRSRQSDDLFDLEEIKASVSQQISLPHTSEWASWLVDIPILWNNGSLEDFRVAIHELIDS